MNRRIINQQQPNQNQMMMMGQNLDAGDLGGQATLGSTQYNIVMTQDQVAQSFGAAGVLPSPYGGLGYTPQLSQMSMDLTAASGQSQSQQQPHHQQQQAKRRMIVKELEMDMNQMDMVKQAISKINKENAELRWVNVQLSEIMEGVVWSKETMLTANRMWKKYNNI